MDDDLHIVVAKRLYEAYEDGLETWEEFSKMWPNLSYAWLRVADEAIEMAHEAVAGFLQRKNDENCARALPKPLGDDKQIKRRHSALSRSSG